MFTFIRNWINPPEPSKLEKLSAKHEELWTELQHAKEQSATWKHTLALKKEEYKRVADELKEMIQEKENQNANEQ